MVADADRLGDVGCACEGGDRESAAEALAQRDDVGRHVLMLVAEQRSGAPDAGLHLVADEQRAFGATDFAQPGQVVAGGNVDATFALHGFDDEGRGLVVDGGARRVEIIKGNHTAFRKQCRVRVAVLGLTNQAECAERAPVKRLLRRHELGAPSRPVGQLDGAVDRLGPRVHQERMGQGAVRKARDALDQLDLGECVEDVGRLHQAAGLVPDRLDKLRVAMADVADRPARHQVQVLLAVSVAHARAVPLHESHRVAVHHRDEVGGFPLSDRVDFHGASSVQTALGDELETSTPTRLGSFSESGQ